MQRRIWCFPQREKKLKCRFISNFFTVPQLSLPSYELDETLFWLLHLPPLLSPSFVFWSFPLLISFFPFLNLCFLQPTSPHLPSKKDPEGNPPKKGNTTNLFPCFFNPLFSLCDDPPLSISDNVSWNARRTYVTAKEKEWSFFQFRMSKNCAERLFEFWYKLCQERGSDPSPRLQRTEQCFHRRKQRGREIRQSVIAKVFRDALFRKELAI